MDSPCSDHSWYHCCFMSLLLFLFSFIDCSTFVQSFSIQESSLPPLSSSLSLSLPFLRRQSKRNCYDNVYSHRHKSRTTTTTTATKFLSSSTSLYQSYSRNDIMDEKSSQKTMTKEHNTVSSSTTLSSSDNNGSANDSSTSNYDTINKVYQNSNVVNAFLQVRKGVPFVTEQMETMVKMIQYFQPNYSSILDLGCGDGTVGWYILSSTTLSEREEGGQQRRRRQERQYDRGEEGEKETTTGQQQKATKKTKTNTTTTIDGSSANSNKERRMVVFVDHSIPMLKEAKKKLIEFQKSTTAITTNNDDDDDDSAKDKGIDDTSNVGDDVEKANDDDKDKDSSNDDDDGDAVTTEVDKDTNTKFHFIQADFSTNDWLNFLPVLQTTNETEERTTTTTTTTTTTSTTTSGRKKEGKTIKKRFDVIVSGYAIHHVSNERKKELYEEIYNLLTPGGIFLNLEHVPNYCDHNDKNKNDDNDGTTTLSITPPLDKIFELSYENCLYTAGIAKTKQDAYNMVQYDMNIDKNENILVPAEDQCHWLRQIGYQYVDCYFKYFILSLFGGIKPRGGGGWEQTNK